MKRRYMKRADDAQYMMAELERHLHGICYDPSAATAADIRDLTEIQECIGKAVRLAKTGIRPNAWIGRIPGDFGASLGGPFFDADFRKGGMPHGDQGKKTHAHSHQGARGQSGQAPVKHKRTEACEEGAKLPEVAGTGSQKGMAQACQNRWSRSAS